MGWAAVPVSQTAECGQSQDGNLGLGAPELPYPFKGREVLRGCRERDFSDGEEDRADARM